MKHQLVVKDESGIAPTFIKPLKITVNKENSKAIISCVVQGMPVPSITWYKGDEEIIPEEGIVTLYNENTGDIALEIINPKQNELVLYTLQAVNTFGRAVGKANLVINTSNKMELPEITEVPKILSPLNAQIVKTGSTLIFKAKFSGIPRPTIQWLKNGKELKQDDFVTILINEDYSTLQITDMNRKRVGKYEVVAKNKVGEAKSSGSVVVSDSKDSEEIKAPRFIKPLIPKTVQENEVVIMESVVESYPTSSFQWFVHGLPIKTSPDVRIVTRENTSVLIVESFKKQHVASYMCRAENVAGSVTSTASINIHEEKITEEVTEYISPRFVEKLKPLRLMDGDKLTLECKVHASPTPKIEWLHNDQTIKENKDISILQDNAGICTLTITEVFPEDAGRYTCHATNEIGEAITQTSISVEGILPYVLMYDR